MKNIFKYLSRSWYIVVIILGLLVVQATCDLALPAYTSDIVDVGISKKGIEETVPYTIRESELLKIKALVPEAEEGIINAYYYKSEELVDGDPVYKINVLTKEDEAYLSQIMRNPLTIYGMSISMKSETGEFSVSEDSSLSAVSSEEMQTLMMTMFASPDRSARLEALDSFMGYFGSMEDSISTAMTAVYIEQEYEITGTDLESYQINYLVWKGIYMLLISAIAMVASIIVGFLASKVAAKTSMQLRNQVFKKVVGFSNAEMDRFSTASLITRSTNDIQQVQMVMIMLLRMVFYAPILGIGGVIKVIHTNVSMSWIIVTAVVMIIILLIVLFTVAMPKFKLMQVLLDKLNLVAREILTGIPVIRAFSTEKHEEARFDKANQELAKTQLFTNRVMTFMMPFMMFLMNAVSLGIIWFGAKGIDNGTMQVGEMMAFMTYAMQIIISFLMFSMISIILPRAGVSASRIEEVITTKTTIENKKEVISLEGKAKGEIQFSNVSFKYPNADNNVVEDIDFSAKPGQTTAIVGSTGCGKSTVVNLIPRFYDITQGSISIDGIDIRDMDLKELRQMLGYVPQNGVLFSGTIDSNIRYGKDDLTKEEVEEAAKIAQATDFISEKSLLFESPISQGGTNVSGGQKQRLSIARAIAKHPLIYIFDDSFSALDYKTDVAVRKALLEKITDSTVIIVAQRISTVLQAEQIIVLDEGRIVGKGTHKELLTSCEVYFQMAQSQLSEEELKKSISEGGADHE